MLTGKQCFSWWKHGGGGGQETRKESSCYENALNSLAHIFSSSRETIRELQIGPPAIKNQHGLNVLTTMLICLDARLSQTILARFLNYVGRICFLQTLLPREKHFLYNPRKNIALVDWGFVHEVSSCRIPEFTQFCKDPAFAPSSHHHGILHRNFDINAIRLNFDLKI